MRCTNACLDSWHTGSVITTVPSVGMLLLTQCLVVNTVLLSVLWRCWLGSRKGIRPVKNCVVGCWRGCLGWGADLPIAQQMPLPLTISCPSKSRLVLTFLVLPFCYLLTRVVPDKFQKSSKTVVCVCVLLLLILNMLNFVPPSSCVM